MAVPPPPQTTKPVAEKVGVDDPSALATSIRSAVTEISQGREAKREKDPFLQFYEDKVAAFVAKAQANPEDTSLSADYKSIENWKSVVDSDRMTLTFGGKSYNRAELVAKRIPEKIKAEFARAKAVFDEVQSAQAEKAKLLAAQTDEKKAQAAQLEGLQKEFDQTSAAYETALSAKGADQDNVAEAKAHFERAFSNISGNYTKLVRVNGYAVLAGAAVDKKRELEGRFNKLDAMYFDTVVAEPEPSVAPPSARSLIPPASDRGVFGAKKTPSPGLAQFLTDLPVGSFGVHAFDGASPTVVAEESRPSRVRGNGVGKVAKISDAELSGVSGTVVTGDKAETRLSYTAQVEGAPSGTSNGAVSELTQIFLKKAAEEIVKVRKTYKLNSGQLLVKVKVARPKNAQSGDGKVEFADVSGKGIPAAAINELKQNLQGLAADYKITEAIVKGIFEEGTGDNIQIHQSGRPFNITIDCAQQVPVS